MESSDGNAKRVKYVRLYGDSAGESHFDDVEAPLPLVDLGPSNPSPPLYLSALEPAARFAFVICPSGWTGDWHPVSQRQIFFQLAGEAEFEVSDGEVRRFGPGSIMLEEATSGKGYKGRSVGEAEVLIGVVQLPD